MNPLSLKKEKFYKSSHFAELFTQSLVCYECMSHQNCFSDDDNYFGAITDCNEDSNACYSMESGTKYVQIQTKLFTLNDSRNSKNCQVIALKFRAL